MHTNYLPIFQLLCDLCSLDPPEVTALHRTVHASVGWGVNISCDVWSDPPSSLEWFRGTGSMEYLDQHTQFQQMVLIYLNRKNFSLLIHFRQSMVPFGTLFHWFHNFRQISQTIPVWQETRLERGKQQFCSLVLSQSLNFNNFVIIQGLPSPPLVSSGELSASLTSYLLSWHTHSFTDIAAYNILYRKLPVSSLTLGSRIIKSLFSVVWSNSLCLGQHRP